MLFWPGYKDTWLVNWHKDLRRLRNMLAKFPCDEIEPVKMDPLLWKALRLNTPLAILRYFMLAMDSAHPVLPGMKLW